MSAEKDLKLLIDIQTKNEQKIDRITDKIRKLKRVQSDLAQDTQGLTKEQKNQFTETKKAFREQIVAQQEKLHNVKKVMKANKNKIKQTKALVKEHRRFKGELLSTMFFGMAITRIFGGFLKSAFQTFNKIAEGTKLSNNGFTRMSAAWNFFKFSFIETLMATDLFKNIVNFVMKLVDWWGNLTEKNKEFYAKLIMIVTAIGAIMTAVGILGLGFGNLIPTIKLVYTTLKANPLILLITGLILVGTLIEHLKNKVGGWGEFFKAVIRGIIRVFFHVTAYLKSAWTDVVKFFIDRLKKFLDVIASIAGVIDRVLGTHMKDSVNKAIDNLEILKNKLTDISTNIKFDAITTGEKFIAKYLPLKNVPEASLGGTQSSQGGVVVNQENNIVVQGGQGDFDAAAVATRNSFEETMKRSGYSTYVS